MTMPTSGEIRMSQAMSETNLGGQQSASAAALSKLAGVNPGQQYSWSNWRGKSNGVLITEQKTQYYNRDLSGACWVNFGRNVHMYTGQISFSGAVGWMITGGDDATPGAFPEYVNGHRLAGIFRFDNKLTVIAQESLDGLRFTSSLGENLILTNDLSWSWFDNGALWTAYAAVSPVWQVSAGSRDYTVSLSGTVNRAQPPNGYVGGTPPPEPPPPDPWQPNGT